MILMRLYLFSIADYDNTDSDNRPISGIYKLSCCMIKLVLLMLLQKVIII